MKYHCNSVLEDMSVRELLTYYRNLKNQYKELRNEVLLGKETIKNAEEELKLKLSYLEDELIIAELDRQETEFADNNTELYVN